MPRKNPSLTQVAVRNRYLALSDLCGLVLALVVAFGVRFEGFAWDPLYRSVALIFGLSVIPLKLVVFFGAGLYRRLWRYAGVAELERVTLATIGVGGLSTVIGGLLLPKLGLLPARVPLSVLALDASLTVFVVAAPRLLASILARRPFGNDGHGKRVLIAGAGSAGNIIAKELLAHPQLGLRPVGFLDDDPRKKGLWLCGMPVFGPPDRLPALRKEYDVEEVIIAMPSAPGSVVRAIVQLAAAAGVSARTIPGMFELLSGRVEIATLRPVRIEDLLRREPIQTDMAQVQGFIEGQVVLVTGAGGSIGSELCRQVAALCPAKLLLLGHGENSIFEIHRELAESFPDVLFVPIIADIRDQERLRATLSPHPPNTIFHAAAHKHVPLMEENVPEAVTNNVLGTRNVAEVAVEMGTTHFVLISTDKAVRSTNVMGATKRVAELIVQDLAERHHRNFIAVRFGNVLGSRGSVVPAFLRQIEAGGPVTVTHPEMRRFFMTIPESVQLVLQAGALGKGGEIFVLDMGEPIRIVDLATDLIRLSGLEVGRDIEIHFTGVRPGEKLNEELFFGKEVANPTEHPKVLSARGVELAKGLLPVVRDLIAGGQAGAPDAELRQLLLRLVPDYRPENSAHNVSGLQSRMVYGAAESAGKPFRSPNS